MTNATAVKSLRQPTLDTLGLGGVLKIFENGKREGLYFSLKKAE